MDSPAHLLKVAVNENNAQTRMNLVVRACKLITDILPFDKKNFTLLEEPDLMKYLMLSIPLNPRVIDMIIVSMINKFKQLPYFLKETWESFLTVAQLDEPGNIHMHKSETIVRHFQHGVKKLLNIMAFQDLDSAPITPSNKFSEYCDEINKNKELLKLAVLDYVETIVVFYTKLLKKTAAFKPDIAGLVKKFILYSPSEKVIVRICTIMERISFFSKDSSMTYEIEELVVTKQSMVFDQQKYLSRTSLDENAKPLAKSGLYSKAKEKLMNITENSRRLGDDLPNSHRNKSENITKKEDPMQMSFNPKYQPVESRVIEDDDDIMARSRYDDFEGTVDTPEARLDEWLSWGELDEIPLISKSNYIYNILKNPGNFEVILAFIFDPHCYTIGECWKAKYPSLVESLDENSALNQSVVSPFFKFQKLKDDKSLQPYMMRSFRAMQALCDMRNMKIIVQTNPRAFETYFSFLFACVNTREDNVCNFNHIAKLTQYLLKKEPDVCVNYLIYYNLPYKFAQNIDFPGVQEFFLTLFNCSYDSMKISAGAFSKISRYSRIIFFFNDVAEAILIGPRGLDAKKCESEYKPNGIENLLNGAMSIGDFETIFSEKPISYRNDTNNALLDDELDGLNLDIDRLHEALDSHRQIDKKKLVINQSFDKKTIPKSILTKYYSLRQKYTPGDKILSDLHEEEPTRETFAQNTNSKGNSQVGSLKRLTDSTDLGRTSLSRGKSNLLLHPKKSDSFASESGQNVRGYILPNTNETPGSLQILKAIDKSIRPSSNQKSSFESRLKTSEGKRDNFRSTFDPKRGENFRALKTKISTEPSEDYGSASLPQITNPNRSGQVWGSRQALETRKTAKEFYFAGPEKMTLAKEYIITDVMTSEEARQLNALYPITNLTRIETDIDKEAKNPEYTANGIRANEGMSIPLCTLLESLIRKMLYTPESGLEIKRNNSNNNEENGKKFRYEMKKKLGCLDVDYSPFWDAMFHENSKFFERILKNYLFKIKVHNLEDTNSGYIAGTIINLLLERSENHHYLNKSFKEMHKTSKAHVKFLSKVIIQSHAWPNRKDINIYLQNHEVTEPLGTGRILLVETLYLIIKNDHSKQYKIIEDINDTCWHTLVTWFFSKKTNNIYHRLFYSLLELTFINCGEKFILNILLKLDLLSSMYKIWGNIYQNNVLIKDNHSESIICHLKKIAALINSISEKNEQYIILKNQLAASISWNYMKPILCPSKAEKKKESTFIPHAKKRMTIKPKEPQILRLSPQPKERASQNNHLRARPGSREVNRDSIFKGSQSSVQLIHHK